MCLFYYFLCYFSFDFFNGYGGVHVPESVCTDYIGYKFDDMQHYLKFYFYCLYECIAV